MEKKTSALMDELKYWKPSSENQPEINECKAVERYLKYNQAAAAADT